jgi:hypothetical protein
MIFWNPFKKKADPAPVDEALDIFANKQRKIMKKAEDIRQKHGEGLGDFSVLHDGYGVMGTSSFNLFYDQYINKEFNTEVQKISNYKRMAQMPEITDVIEDAVNESTQEDSNGDIITLDILDDEINKNENARDTIYKEFEKLFHKSLRINRIIDDFFYAFYTDGRLYLENIVNTKKKSDGIIGIKRLPAESMDFQYDPRTGKINFFVQYRNPQNAKLPRTLEEGEKSKDVVAFFPSQITFIDSGRYGRTRKDILGYLEKVKQPFNQLKLLETSVIIYRIVRAPERFVFKIDVGNMPRDKAMKFIEKVKMKMQKKVTYDPTTGEMSNQPEIMSVIENFFIPTSPEGRGSDIDSVGGNASGFTELDDLYYFAEKMYRALKYPMSRIRGRFEKREGDIMFGGGGAEIARDEIKWGKFLKKNQDKFADALEDLFMLHLDFTGLKSEYDIDKSKFNIEFNVPNDYVASVVQQAFESRSSNFSTLASYTEFFSKTFLLKKYLELSDEEIKENAEGFKKDKELFPQEDDGF